MRYRHHKSKTIRADVPFAVYDRVIWIVLFPRRMGGGREGNLHQSNSCGVLLDNNHVTERVTLFEMLLVVTLIHPLYRFLGREAFTLK